MLPHHDPHADAPIPLSSQLHEIIAEAPEKLSFTELAEWLDARAWGGLLLVFAAINMLPLPPGTSAFFALPLMIIAVQMVMGRAAPWFPSKLDRRGVSRKELARLVGKVEWVEQKIERLFRPRLPQLTGAMATRLIGLTCFLLALIAAVPIPLFHIAPAAAIAVFGLALIYRDGLLLMFACLVAVLSLAFDALLLGSGLEALAYMTAWLRH